MASPEFVQIPPHRLDRFRSLMGDGFDRIEEAAERARGRFEGRVIWHVSSTRRGGGVAEMLSSMLPYARGAGIDTRWVVLREAHEFFVLTKRLHNNLHGQPGDGGPLEDEERQLYERTLTASAAHLTPLFRSGDVAFLHDPQTAGLAPAAKEAGAHVVWRCHIGADQADDTVRRAWDFLAPYVRVADVCVFSRREYVWDLLEADGARVMAPSIDPFSPKNQEMSPETTAAILGAIGLGPEVRSPAPTYARADGSPARVERRAELLQEGPLPEGETTVAQVSRWDRLKDHRGLLDCFERHLSTDDVRLLLAGPSTAAVADDPEGAAVWTEIGDAWRRLPPSSRSRVHLVSLPMEDPEENAAMVNALQRRADVVVQKSLAEGFGLTVAEAMWKRKPVIGSRVGGIQDQIVDRVSGVLIDDPRDLESLAAAIGALAHDRETAAEIGERARQRVFDRFLVANRLVEYADLIAGLGSDASRPQPRS